MLEPIDINIYENDELKHFGILGMHWGIRRFQNPDGTLTPEGRERYLKNDSVTGKKTLTEEGYKHFFNREMHESPEGKAKDIAVIMAPTGIGAAVGAATPLGPLTGAALGSLLSVVAGVSALDPQMKKGLTKEGGEFFYDTNTGELTDEAKQMIFDDKQLLTDLGSRWINEQYDKNVFGDVPGSPEYKVNKMLGERNTELQRYVYKNIMPICGDMPVSLYLAKEMKSDNPSKEYKAYKKYAEELNKKYYDRVMKEL